MKITTKVWKFNYTNLFAELTADVINNDKYNPRKYMAVHHLSINLSRNLNIGLFEAVMFNRDDSTGNGGFELNYLNPIIFYREVESYLGSKDKTSVGIDLKWNFLKHFSFYGQFVLNEFKLSHLQAQNGWWGNKYAWQLGLKYIDAAGIKNLDLQLEHNFVRPFMYADKNRYSSISNYNQPLAHPLGANFFEVIGIIRYQPINRLFVTGKAFYIVQGKDHSGLNFGSNILKETGTRTNEFGNNIGVGDKTNTILVSLNVSYMLFHNFYIDLREQYRMEKNSSITNSSLYTSLGIRWNIAQRLHEF